MNRFPRLLMPGAACHHHRLRSDRTLPSDPSLANDNQPMQTPPVDAQTGVPQPEQTAPVSAQPREVVCQTGQAQRRHADHAALRRLL